PVDVSIHTLQSSSLRPASSWEISFPQGVVWGLMGCVMAFGTSITAERSRGTLQRLTIAPVTKSDILAGKALACFITCVIVQCIMLGMAVLVFGVRPSNPLMMAASIAVTSLGFVGVMMLIAGMSRTEGSAQGLARALLLILAMIGGGSVPTFFLPAIIQKFSLISPFTWAMRALEGALWRHYSWPEFALPAGILLAIAAVGYIVGVTGLRWGENA
ncbi:MAG: ABC transporter permease, partial [Phycisphaerales bacterium]